MTQKSKKSRKIILLVISLLIIVVSATLALLAIKHVEDTYVDDKPTILNDPRLERDEVLPEGDWSVAADEPRYLSIDKLGISNARVVSVGIKDGTYNQLDDPQNIHNVGWYNKSTKPGYGTSTNTAGLYDGHNTGYAADGVFVNLGKLALGDLIKVERGDGEIFYFEVREVEMPLLEDIDMAKMSRNVEDGKEGLNIISCGGEWDGARNTYTHRVTARASLQQ